MNKITLLIGLNDKDTKKQEISFTVALGILADYIAQNVGFGTLSQAAGVYTHDNGATVQETSIRAEFFTEDVEKIIEFARFAKSTLNQESIAMEVSAPKFELI